MLFLQRTHTNSFEEEYFCVSGSLVMQTSVRTCIMRGSGKEYRCGFSRLCRKVFITTYFEGCLIEKTLLWGNSFVECEFDNVVFLSSVLASTFVNCTFNKCTFVDCKIGGMFKDCAVSGGFSVKSYIITDTFPTMTSADDKCRSVSLLKDKDM